MAKLCYNTAFFSLKIKLEIKEILIMVIDDTLLNKLEKLSALQIPEEKREEFKKQLGEIVNFT